MHVFPSVVAEDSADLRVERDTRFGFGVASWSIEGRLDAVTRDVYSLTWNTSEAAKARLAVAGVGFPPMLPLGPENDLPARRVVVRPVADAVTLVRYGAHDYALTRTQRTEESPVAIPFATFLATQLLAYVLVNLEHVVEGMCGALHK